MKNLLAVALGYRGVANPPSGGGYHGGGRGRSQLSHQGCKFFAGRRCHCFFPASFENAHLRRFPQHDCGTSANGGEKKKKIRREVLPMHKSPLRSRSFANSRSSRSLSDGKTKCSVMSTKMPATCNLTMLATVRNGKELNHFLTVILATWLA